MLRALSLAAPAELLYSVSSVDDGLSVVNPTTGMVTAIGALDPTTGAGTYIGGPAEPRNLFSIQFAADGYLYGVGGGGPNSRIDLSTGALTEIPGPGPGSALARAPDGEMLGLTFGGYLTRNVDLVAGTYDPSPSPTLPAGFDRIRAMGFVIDPEGSIGLVSARLTEIDPTVEVTSSLNAFGNVSVRFDGARPTVSGSFFNPDNGFTYSYDSFGTVVLVRDADGNSIDPADALFDPVETTIPGENHEVFLDLDLETGVFDNLRPYSGTGGLPQAMGYAVSVPIPEPSTFPLVTAGLALLAARRDRRRPTEAS